MQKVKINEARPKFTGSYKKKRVVGANNALCATVVILFDQKVALVILQNYLSQYNCQSLKKM